MTDPGRQIFRRAANLLNSNGQSVVPELDGQVSPHQEALSLARARSQSPPTTNLKLGASIKRKFKKVTAAAGVARSNTYSVRSSAEEAASDTVKWNVKSRHIRAFSQPEIQQLTAKSVEPPVLTMTDVTVPQSLQQGTHLTKVSGGKKQKTILFRVDPDEGQILWESKKHRIIPIETIKELRSGSDARYYREQFRLAQEYEDRWLTIIYVLDGNYKSLHLIAPDKEMFRLWDTTLRKLHAIRQELMSGLGNIEMRQAVWEKQYWKGADTQSDQMLDFDDVERLCKRLNINSPTEDLFRLFKQADSQNRNFLDFTDFRRFVKLLKARPELDLLYKKICSMNGGRLDFEAFTKFMRQSQKSKLTEEELRRIFSKYSAQPPILTSAAPVQTPHASPALDSPSIVTTSIEPPEMSPSAFTSFLLSPENAAFTDQNAVITHDMTRPLSEYYISSSHNTYLVGNQLVGVSTIEGYIRALLHSCRSVELDIYDGDNEPMIFHGKTFTSKVSLREVCTAIAKYAFVTSPYPVIISAEIHCGVAQQDMMVDIMCQVFGDALISAPIDGRPKIDVLPSPEDLKGRFLLKAKNLHINTAELQGTKCRDVLVEAESSETSDSDVIVQDIKVEWRKVKARESEVAKELKQEFQKARGVMERVHRSMAPTSPHSAKSKQDGQAPKAKMSIALATLLVYTVGVKCRGINKKEEYAPEHVFSLSESTANKILKQSMVDLIKHCRTHVVRIYPKGLRLNSTNYEPHRYWSAGVQLVAINCQTFDLGYMINLAMFQRNGRSGYVLKPLALRVPDKDILSKRTKHILDVTIISAQQLPRPKDASGREIIDKSMVDPLVEVSIHVPDWTHSALAPDAVAAAYAVPAGASSASATSARTVAFRTGSVKNNGFNPVWQEALCLPFDCVGDMQDLVFVRFVVKQEDEDDEPLAVYCSSLGSLEQGACPCCLPDASYGCWAAGFRHLPLHDSQLSQYLFSTLFVQIGIRDVV
jgi:phosphatidylinositol phospholipase C delta